MDWLNYHHLLYFWTTAREGSIARAAAKLHVTQPTLSKQLGQLEKSVGAKLFQRSGRGRVLTEMGQTVFRYADEIFTLGQELKDVVRGQQVRPGSRLVVGVPDVMPKLIAYRLLQPVFRLSEPVEMFCYESSFESLLSDLAAHRFDVVLSDTPIGARIRVKAYNHLLGECGVTIFGTADLAQDRRDGFPQSLDGAPLLLPTEDTELRRSLDQWFETQGVRPRVVGHFYDSALLKEFGHAGVGLFPAPTAIEREVQRQYHVEVIGRIEAVRERFYAITIERRIKHPAVLAISESAQRDLFA
ncbi:MAG: transcriptional activator NhaR [Pirellulaceae bacterium]